MKILGSGSQMDFGIRSRIIIKEYEKSVLLLFLLVDQINIS
jgi:hypothetical protein